MAVADDDGGSGGCGNGGGAGGGDGSGGGTTSAKTGTAENIRAVQRKPRWRARGSRHFCSSRPTTRECNHVVQCVNTKTGATRENTTLLDRQ